MENITSFKAEANLKRGPISRFVDHLLDFCGKPALIGINFFIVISWIAINSGVLGNLIVIDPPYAAIFPTLISIEALFLSLLVLISQRRQTLISDIREEASLKLSLRSQEQHSKMLRMLKNIENKLSIADREDKDYSELTGGIDAHQVVSKIEAELQEKSEESVN